MKNVIISLKHWLAQFFKRLACFLESEAPTEDNQSKFVDLAPTDEADETGVYSEAITFATNNTKVFNIALTGPYGSGKSSVIQSFLKRYRRPALHISLATFLAEAASGEQVSRQEIERSILQQMLFGADANKLPLSRFKRIQTPNVWSFFKSLYIMLGICALWYAIHQRDEVISGAFFVPFSYANWFNLGSFILATTFLWVTLHHLYVASFGLSIKSISLKDVEIRPAHDDQASILNRHLDEIIYFFQSTDYSLVIIEDLDRFENAEIFVTLREINSLVNQNVGVKRTIRFLYALRDDMFANTDRTKFFEFIIPVIPIINTSNSIDMVLKQGRRLELDERLDRQFLREVSRYLNDLRLIQNIFNEYAIYVANLETDGDNLLDTNKLLAILIYKNVYPRDFEQLHRGEGALAGILNLQEKLVIHGEAKYKAEIADIENRLEGAERQIPLDLKELRSIYATALMEKIPKGPNPVAVSLDRRVWIPLTDLASHDAFEQLIEATTIQYRNIHNNEHQFDNSKLQSDTYSKKSYIERKTEIESKSADNKNKSMLRISELRSKLTAMRSTKLDELLRLNADSLQDLFKDFNGNGELARFLVLEGHLDDTYYQYTSLFHSGRLSPADNKFLIKIRAFITPEPSFPIDNPKEVIAAMRDEDFRRSYVLNVELVDTLLCNQSEYLSQTQKLFEFVSLEFDSCEDFFDVYYSSGREVKGLLSGLSKFWTGLVPAAIASPNNTDHISQLLSCLPVTSLQMLSRQFGKLPEFVSANLPEILMKSPELAAERLGKLGFEVRDLSLIKNYPKIVGYMSQEGLYDLTIENLEYIYQFILEESDLDSFHCRNFTTIRAEKNLSLLQRVERDFDLYLRDILLALQDNSEEDVSAILVVARQDELDEANLLEFLERQTNMLPTLEGVPERLYNKLFQLNVIEPTWINCLTYLKSEGYEEDSLVYYLDRDEVRTAILQHAIPSDSDSLVLRKFLIEANSLSNAAYREYVHALPKPFKMPPEELDDDKLRILIDERAIEFSKESLNALADNEVLQVLFVAANIDTYLVAADSFALDDNFLEDLILSDTSHANKLRLIELMDTETLASLPERAELIGSIIKNSKDKEFELNVEVDVIRSIVEHSKPLETQILLLNKFHSRLSDDEVRQALVNLPRPYSEIKTGYSTPRLKNNAANKELANWLESRDIISSWSIGSFLSDDIKVNLYRG